MSSWIGAGRNFEIGRFLPTPVSSALPSISRPGPDTPLNAGGSLRPLLWGPDQRSSHSTTCVRSLLSPVGLFPTPSLAVHVRPRHLSNPKEELPMQGRRPRLAQRAYPR